MGMESKAVTFDDKGWREALTVRSCAWDSFVDRQRAKLRKEISTSKASGAPRSRPGGSESSCSLSSDNIEGAANVLVPSEVSELESLVDSMQDWKDLTRYSGKSVSMASTVQRNEMKIHVVAFVVREDGRAVDFMRHSCTL